MPKKILALWLLTLVVVVFAYAFFSKSQRFSRNFFHTEKIDVAVSIYPIAHFVSKVGGDEVTVHLVTPGGTEPHEYEPTPRDIGQVESSQVFFYNGGGVDPWAEHIAPELRNKKIVVSKMMDNIVDFQNNSEDPHIWLDPIYVQSEVSSIKNILSSVEPSKKDIFEKNANAYLSELLQLDFAYKNGLAHCAFREIITSHDAFNYLGARYGFMVDAITGVSPDQEPSAARFAELVRIIKQKQIPTVFFETLVTPQLAETLAHEAGAVTAVLSPIEGLNADEQKAGKNYDVLMKENLVALQKAMLCQ